MLGATPHEFESRILRQLGGPDLDQGPASGVCPSENTPAPRAQGVGLQRPGRRTRRSVRCPHDRLPKGQCRVGARQPCVATFPPVDRGSDGTRSSTGSPVLVPPICVGLSGPASGPKPRKKRSGTGRPWPTAPSDNSLTRWWALAAKSSSAGATASTSAATSKPCFTPCRGRARVSCVPSSGPSTGRSWPERRCSRPAAWTCRGGEGRSRTMGGNPPRGTLSKGPTVRGDPSTSGAEIGESACAFCGMGIDLELHSSRPTHSNWRKSRGTLLRSSYTGTAMRWARSPGSTGIAHCGRSVRGHVDERATGHWPSARCVGCGRGAVMSVSSPHCSTLP